MNRGQAAPAIFRALAIVVPYGPGNGLDLPARAHIDTAGLGER